MSEPWQFFVFIFGFYAIGFGIPLIFVFIPWNRSINRRAAELEKRRGRLTDCEVMEDEHHD